MANSTSLTPCIGCGALVPAVEGTAHRYIGASPGCWAILGEVRAREYSDLQYAVVNGLTFNTYAVQHPGTPSRQSIQSVAVHLIGLYWALEHGYNFRMATDAMTRALTHREAFVWLDPPASLGEITILDVQKAKDAAEHIELVNQWARSVWEAWVAHHATIRRWASL